MSQFVVRILGPVQVLDGDREVRLGSPARRRVLLALLLAAGRPLPLDRLIDISWPERTPATAANLIHGYISGLRKALEPERSPREPGSVLELGPGGYRLVLDRGGIDAVRFEQLLDEATRQLDAEPARALELLDQALALWHGCALADVADEDFARHDAARLEELRLLAIERRFAAALATGRGAGTVAELEAFAAAHPLREHTTALLMTALYRAGRQADALRAFTVTSHALRDELGLDPSPELRALELSVLQQNPGLVPAIAVGDNLPVPVSSFVGRTREVTELTRAITTARLLTLVGPGGVGKTRLAIEVASARRSVDSDGAWFVDLSRVRSASGVARALAEPFGVRESKDVDLLDALADHLRAKELLLVVDNCEQVIDEVARALAHLLRCCPSMRIIATSRESLRVDGEVLFVVPPLPLPEADELATPQAEPSDAVRLFAERAAAAQPGFRLDPESSVAVANICRRLDGLPLAIELAAPVVNVLSLRQIGERLDDRLGMLVGGSRDADERHVSLEATMWWSYELLTQAEQELFETLSVFSGDFTLDAVVSVLGVPDDAVETSAVFARLVAKSLVTVRDRHADPPRFGLLESTREFADERLRVRGVRAATRQRHAEVYAELAAGAAAASRTADSAEYLDGVARDLDEMRTALRWSFGDDGDHALGQRIAASLSWFWFIRGPLSEAQDWLSVAIRVPVADAAVRRRLLYAATLTAIPQAEFVRASELAHEHLADARRDGDQREAAEATEMLGILAWVRGDYGEARQLLLDAVRMSEEAGAAWSAIGQRTSLGRVAADLGEIDEARRCLDTALAGARQLGEPFNIAVALEFLAQLALSEGDTSRAGTLVDEALASYQSIGYQEGIASALQTAAVVAHRRGDVTNASHRWAESLDLCAQIGTIGGIPAALEGLARVGLAESAPDAAGRLLGAADALRTRLGVPVPASLVADRDALLDAARSALGESFGQVWGTGAAMPFDVVLADAAGLATGITSG